MLRHHPLYSEDSGHTQRYTQPRGSGSPAMSRSRGSGSANRSYVLRRCDGRELIRELLVGPAAWWISVTDKSENPVSDALGLRYIIRKYLAAQDLLSLRQTNRPSSGLPPLPRRPNQ